MLPTGTPFPKPFEAHGLHADRDCAMKNLMMDADGMYSEGFHPVNITLLPDGRRLAHPTPREFARPPVKYYFVDFGISVLLPRNAPSRHVVGLDGLDRDVPELSSTQPYDPFKVDIFIIGNTLRRKILQVSCCLTAKFAVPDHIPEISQSRLFTTLDPFDDTKRSDCSS